MPGQARRRESAFTDHPPTGAVFVSATAQTSAPADGTFDGPSNIWSVAVLAPGGQAQMNVIYDTSAGPGINYAQVTAATIDDPDSTPGTVPLSDTNLPGEDDEASASAPALSDVSVTNVVAAAPTHVGDLVEFTVTTRNDGPNATSGVSITDQLPVGLVFIDSTPSVGTYDPVTGVWTVGDLASGGAAALTITARVMAPGTISTTAELTSSTTPDVDSTPNNGISTKDDQADAAIATTGASLGDTVSFDRNNDFTRDGDEPGLAGVVVRAVWASPDGGSDVTYTATTDSTGAWALAGLPYGDHTITVDSTTLPHGITAGDPRSRRGRFGTHDHLDARRWPGGQRARTSRTPDPASSATPFFAAPTAAGRPPQTKGSTGSRCHSHGSVSDGVSSLGDTVTTTVTDQFGNYRFSNLPAGNFTVSVDGSTLPSGLVNTIDPDGANDNRAAAVLAVGERRDDLDFGYGTKAIGDTVFADTDGDGIQDIDEVGLGGVEVVLLRDVDLDGTFETTLATTRTSGTGTYRFDQLAGGSYQVALTAPTGLTSTTPATVDVVADNGDEVLTADFGLQPVTAAPGSIGDLVWNDADGDGIFDAGEAGIPGVSVTLRADTDGDGIFESTG